MVQESRYWLGAPKRNPYATSKQALPPGSSAFTRNATEPWRTQICQWYFQVSDCFDFDRGVVFVALNYLDRAVAQNCETLKFTTNRELQLVAVTALYLAMKLHGEIEPATSQAKGSKYERKKLTIDAFVVLSKRHFDVCAIETMELDLLSILKWQLNPIDARVFVACMLELMTERNTYLQEWRCIFDIARYIAELSLGEVDLVFSTRPSVVACASILCAINSLGRAGRSLPPMHVLQHMSTSIYEATSLSLDMEAVTQTAIRLTHLCPSIFVKEPSAHADEYYTDEARGYTDYAAQEKSLRATFRLFMNNLEKKRLTGKTLLEVGCGYGYLLDEAKNFFAYRVWYRICTAGCRRGPAQG